MAQRWVFLVSLSLASLAAPTLRAQGQVAPPTISVQVQSLDAVLKNLKLLVVMSGREEIASKVEGLVKTKIGPKGLEGIDTNRPFGAYFRFGKDLSDFSGVILAPIADEKAFLSLLENGLNIKVIKDANTGIYTASANTPFYFRFANKYVYATTLRVDSSLDVKNLLPPASVFSTAQKSTISLVLQLDQLPRDLKTIARLGLMQTMQDAQDTKLPGETPTQKTLRVEVMKGVVEQFTAILNEGKQFGIDIDVHKASEEISATFSLTAQSDSGLAKTIADIGKVKSLFGGLRAKDAALQASVTMGLSKNLQKLFASAVDEARFTILKELNDAGKKKQAEALLDALSPTLRAGEVDAALLMTGPKGKAYSFIAAVKLHEGAKLNKTVQEFLEEVVKQIPVEARDQLRLNADIAGGTSIHRFKLTYGPIEKELLGDSPIYLAIRDDAFFVATGPDGLANLKAALSATNAIPAPPLSFEISLSRLAPLMDGPNRDKLMALFDPGRGGSIRLSLEGGSRLQVRITTHQSALRFIGELTDKK